MPCHSRTNEIYLTQLGHTRHGAPEPAGPNDRGCRAEPAADRRCARTIIRRAPRRRSALALPGVDDGADRRRPPDCRRHREVEAALRPASTTAHIAGKRGDTMTHFRPPAVSTPPGALSGRAGRSARTDAGRRALGPAQAAHGRAVRKHFLQRFDQDLLRELLSHCQPEPKRGSGERQGQF